VTLIYISSNTAARGGGREEQIRRDQHRLREGGGDEREFKRLERVSDLRSCTWEKMESS